LESDSFPIDDILFVVTWGCEHGLGGLGLSLAEYTHSQLGCVVKAATDKGLLSQTSLLALPEILGLQGLVIVTFQACVLAHLKVARFAILASLLFVISLSTCIFLPVVVWKSFPIGDIEFVVTWGSQLVLGGSRVSLTQHTGLGFGCVVKAATHKCLLCETGYFALLQTGGLQGLVIVTAQTSVAANLELVVLATFIFMC
jgi:hypothetical protein